jgi:hypothetical protein
VTPRVLFNNGDSLPQWLEPIDPELVCYDGITVAGSVMRSLSF